mmetsp:Transcript_26500/g.106103  ORF Transcript_26500/g.106103 Transcript_26500/m.106103 type:complete len:236 (-) Transcript_26500:832-1539(-)
MPPTMPFNTVLLSSDSSTTTTTSRAKKRWLLDDGVGVPGCCGHSESRGARASARVVFARERGRFADDSDQQQPAISITITALNAQFKELPHIRITTYEPSPLRRCAVEPHRDSTPCAAGTSQPPGCIISTFTSEIPSTTTTSRAGNGGHRAVGVSRRPCALSVRRVSRGRRRCRPRVPHARGAVRRSLGIDRQTTGALEAHDERRHPRRTASSFRGASLRRMAPLVVAVTRHVVS